MKSKPDYSLSKSFGIALCCCTMLVLSGTSFAQKFPVKELGPFNPNLEGTRGAGRFTLYDGFVLDQSYRDGASRALLWNPSLDNKGAFSESSQGCGRFDWHNLDDAYNVAPAYRGNGHSMTAGGHGRPGSISNMDPYTFGRKYAAAAYMNRCAQLNVDPGDLKLYLSSCHSQDLFQGSTNAERFTQGLNDGLADFGVTDRSVLVYAPEQQGEVSFGQKDNRYKPVQCKPVDAPDKIEPPAKDCKRVALRNVTRGATTAGAGFVVGYMGSHLAAENADAVGMRPYDASTIGGFLSGVIAEIAFTGKAATSLSPWGLALTATGWMAFEPDRIEMMERAAEVNNKVSQESIRNGGRPIPFYGSGHP